MIRTIFFDLDGTLLPMNQDVFTKAYFKRLAGKLAPLGYEAQKLVDSIWRGTAAMVKNDGGRSNEEAFWNCFCESKPNPNYYAELLKELGCAPEETLMVGNDVDEDMVAESLGMKVFLLTDCLINRAGRELEHYPRGGFGELRRYLEI